MTSFPALGTTAEILVSHPNRLPMATALLQSSLEAIDAACSRFRTDSEISQLPPGRPTEVSPLLAEAIEVALRAARLTDGLVDPTVGGAMRALGYDRDFASIVDGSVTVAPAPGVAEVHGRRIAPESGADQCCVPGAAYRVGGLRWVCAVELA